MEELKYQDIHIYYKCFLLLEKCDNLNCTNCFKHISLPGNKCMSDELFLYTVRLFNKYLVNVVVTSIYQLNVLFKYCENIKQINIYNIICEKMYIPYNKNLKDIILLKCNILNLKISDNFKFFKYFSITFSTIKNIIINCDLKTSHVELSGFRYINGCVGDIIIKLNPIKRAYLLSCNFNNLNFIKNISENCHIFYDDYNNPLKYYDYSVFNKIKKYKLRINKFHYSLKDLNERSVKIDNMTLDLFISKKFCSSVVDSDENIIIIEYYEKCYKNYLKKYNLNTLEDVLILERVYDRLWH